MSVIGSPIDTSLLQAAQAQQVAARARDREKAARETAASRFRDLVDLRAAGVTGAQAPRKVPANDSQQADAERKPLNAYPDEGDDDAPRIDVQA